MVEAEPIPLETQAGRSQYRQTKLKEINLPESSGVRQLFTCLVVSCLSQGRVFSCKFKKKRELWRRQSTGERWLPRKEKHVWRQACLVPRAQEEKQGTGRQGNWKNKAEDAPAEQKAYGEALRHGREGHAALPKTDISASVAIRIAVISLWRAWGHSSCRTGWGGQKHFRPGCCYQDSLECQLSITSCHAVWDPGGGRRLYVCGLTSPEQPPSADG